MDDSDHEDESVVLPSYLAPHVHHHYGDFWVSASFDPPLIAHLMYEGFLPIATSYGYQRILLPKLHAHRCIIFWQHLHISQSVKKKSKRWKISINTAFDKVVQGCHKQHGIPWLYPEIVHAFRQMCDKGHTGMPINYLNSNHHHIKKNSLTGRSIIIAPERKKKRISSTTTTAPNTNTATSTTAVTAKTTDALAATSARSPVVRFYSIEIWDKESGDLAAGELGYTVGAVYTSLTGFYAMDGAGSAQMAALGYLLNTQGFKFWDLGMMMDYKMQMGAQNVDRARFLKLLYKYRHEDKIIQCPRGGEVRELLRAQIILNNTNTNTSTKVPSSQSKNQLEPSLLV